jgi:hypothetical protein
VCASKESQPDTHESFVKKWQPETFLSGENCQRLPIDKSMKGSLSFPAQSTPRVPELQT